MPIYKQTTEITNIDDLLSSVERDIEEVYFGDKQVFTVWAEYDGTLPATYTANGSALADYRVYGAAGGVGNRTGNLFDKDAKDTSKGYVNNKYLTSNGYENTSNSYFISEYMPVTGGGNYVLCNAAPLSNAAAICFYTLEKVYIRGVSYASQETVAVAAPANAAYARATIYKTQTNVMLTPGSTAPAEYVPYGYVVPMSVSDGTTSTTTQIYIGSSPLGEDEYVDYGEQKVYRRTVNQFNKDTALDGYEIVNNGYNRNENWCISDFIPVESDTLYKSKNSGGAVLSFTDKSSQPTRISGALNTNGVRTLSETKFIKLNCQISQKASCVVAKSDDLPETYIPYLQPTDPPVPLPALPTVDGTNIVDYAGQSAAVPSRFYAKYRKG